MLECHQCHALFTFWFFVISRPNSFTLPVTLLPWIYGNVCSFGFCISGGPLNFQILDITSLVMIFVLLQSCLMNIFCLTFLLLLVIKNPKLDSCLCVNLGPCLHFYLYYDTINNCLISQSHSSHKLKFPHAVSPC